MRSSPTTRPSLLTLTWTQSERTASVPQLWLRCHKLAPPVDARRTSSTSRSVEATVEATAVERSAGMKECGDSKISVSGHMSRLSGVTSNSSHHVAFATQISVKSTAEFTRGKRTVDTQTFWARSGDCMLYKLWVQQALVKTDRGCKHL